MVIWIVYYKRAMEINMPFIDRIINTGTGYGMDIELVAVEDIDKKLSDTVPDAVIARMINPQLTKRLEANGIRVFNNYNTSYICNNKALTIRKINRIGIKHVPSIVVSSKDTSLHNEFEYGLINNTAGNYCEYDEMINNNYKKLIGIFDCCRMSGAGSAVFNAACDTGGESINYAGIAGDYVIKSVTGHGGREVYIYSDYINRCDNLPAQEPDAKAYYRELYLIQPYIKCGRRDLRVYIIGGTIIGAVLRKTDKGFKANYSLGGNISLYDLSIKQKNVINRIISEFNFDYAGIDFFLDENDNLTFNEIEDVVGAKMLSACSDIDYVSMYLEHISKYVS